MSTFSPYREPAKKAAPRWTPMTEAAEKNGIRRATLSALVKRQKLKSRKDPLDARVTLVDLNEVEALKVRSTE